MNIIIFICLHRSILPHDALPHLSMEERRMYERVWDESDYVIPPAENSAFFVMTNLVITPNQTIGTCPEDHTEMKGVVCGTSEGDRVNITEGICVERDVKILHKGHGEETGNCVMSDRDNSAYVCEIDSWCPGIILTSIQVLRKYDTVNLYFWYIVIIIIKIT